MAGIDLQRRIERGDVFVEVQDAPHVGHRPVDQRRHPLDRSLAGRRRFEVAHGAQHEVDFLDHMHRQPDGARLVHDRALDGLADPPGRIGREAEAALGIEFFQRVDQAEIALLDQVEERDAAVEVMLGDIHDQAQVVLDHFLARREIAGAHQTRRRQFVGRRQQRLGADFVQVELGDVLEEFQFGR